MELQQQNQDKKEQRILKQKIEILERENHALKKSLYELSTRFNALKVQPLVLSELLTKSPDESTNYDSKELPDTSGYSRENRPKQFSQKSEFKGHAGAVYIVKFSSCGRLLGSGSFDKSIRIWDWSAQKEQLVLNGHELNISDLSWSQSSSLLLSGAYDQTCKIWDIEQGKLLESYDTDGFVQCVAFNPIDSNIFFSGTSRNILEMKDRRIKVGSGLVFKNDSMVNTMSVYLDGLYIVSGDANGYLKTWDTRTGQCISSFLNDPGQNPISHISCCEFEDEDPRFFAVNSYDNVMRVYDRGIIQPYSTFTLTHALKGYKNKNWPIKSSFYKIRNDQSKLLGKTISSDEIFSAKDLTAEARELHNFETQKVNDVYALLATGSADPYIYVYSIGMTEGASDLMHKIEGHTDRVYSCHFHPTEMVLASGSADFSVRIWSLNSRKRLK